MKAKIKQRSLFLSHLLSFKHTSFCFYTSFVGTLLKCRQSDPSPMLMLFFSRRLHLTFGHQNLTFMSVLLTPKMVKHAYNTLIFPWLLKSHSFFSQEECTAKIKEDGRCKESTRTLCPRQPKKKKHKQRITTSFF